ncbi:MAG: serine/threonine protein kinase, partial [Phycisphaerales bacterium]|nr:serine/threonine protein kinase [Phycisphaerales bacterium]
MTERTTSDATTIDPVDWSRAKDIFLDALDLEPPERAGFLDEQCGADAHLRDAVDRLLASHGSATDFLVDAGSHTPLAQTPEEAPLPRAFGPYEPVERLGEGGHGMVYRAKQHAPVQREVALKVLKPGLESAQLISRFADERRFLARMDHPDIVKIFDAGGTPDGRLFVAMELVQGLPMTEYADWKGLDIRERVAITARLCRAVQHAHQRAVMHRDLKPTNILVSDGDAGPRLRIIDFGIARALADDDNPDLTRTMRAIGTPKYMSPEQAGSGFPVDTRTDIYAIGVILCELLTGKTPRPPATGDRSSTRPSSASAPSKLADESVAPGRTPHTLRGDLDRIVLKCVAWEPDLRYASAAALADDLE